MVAEIIPEVRTLSPKVTSCRRVPWPKIRQSGSPVSPGPSSAGDEALPSALKSLSLQSKLVSACGLPQGEEMVSLFHFIFRNLHLIQQVFEDLL